MSNYAVILAGGNGTRMQPFSTKAKPKQFRTIVDPEFSMLQLTYYGLLQGFSEKKILVLANEKHKSLVKRQIPSILDENIILEPFSRNTLPPMAIASLLISLRDEDAKILFTPCDMYIDDWKEANSCFSLGFKLIKQICFLDSFVIFGLRPYYDSNQYGCIKLSDTFELGSDIRKIDGFLEKPDIRRIHGDNYLWNSGMFVCGASSFLKNLFLHDTEHYILENLYQNIFYSDKVYLDNHALLNYYNAVPSVSVDVGLMEKMDNLYNYRTQYSWYDVGSWPALEQLYHQMPTRLLGDGIKQVQKVLKSRNVE